MRMSLDICVDLAVDALPEGVVQRFAGAPEDTLRRDLGIKVLAVDHLAERREDAGVCDGISFLKDAVVLYRRTGNRRENFTLAHELGHWLVDQIDEVYDWLAQQSDPARMLETVCDRIAQRLLLPDDLVARVLGNEPVSARHVKGLVDASRASAPTCAIALASRLPTLGAVVLVDKSTLETEYASVRPDPDLGWPRAFPWPGHILPQGHPLARLRTGQSRTQKTYWQVPWGARQEYYMDAVAHSGRAIAVFSDTDLWGAEVLHLDKPREFDERPLLETYCCGETRQVRGYPCSDCGEAFCPQCHRCRCDRRAAAESRCSRCFLLFQKHLLVDNRCEDCR